MLQNKVITITSIEQRDNRFIVKDQDDLQYSFFTTKKDGNETQAFFTFQKSNHGGQLGIGNHCQITYKEESSFSQKANKNISYRTIVSFLGGVQPPAPTSIPKTQNAPQQPILATTQSYKPNGHESNNEFGKRLAIHGFVNGLLASGKDPAYIRDHLPSLLALEEAIEKALIDGKPEMQQDNYDDINVDEIPF